MEERTDNMTLQEMLKNKYSETISNLNSSDVVNAGENITGSFIAYVKDQIPAFFSSNNGGVIIRKIYACLKENPNYGKPLKSRDIGFSAKEWTNYIKGMDAWVLKTYSDIEGNVKTPCEVSEFLNGVIERSKLFTSELFADHYNPLDTCTINEAMKDIEFLIEFRKQLADIEDVSLDHIRRTSNKFPLECDLRKKIALMYYECYINYIYLITNEVYTTFNEITKALKDTEDEASSVVSGMRMF